MKLLKIELHFILLICMFYLTIGCTPSEVMPSISETSTPINEATTKPKTTSTQIPPLATEISTEESLPVILPENGVFIKYEIQVSFDYNRHSASVEQTIKYINPLEQPVRELLLACDALRTADVFDLVTLKLNKQSLNVEMGSYWLKIPLDSPLQQGESITLELEYKLQLPLIPEPSDDRKPTIFGYTPLQTNFADWYPMIVPRDAQGEWVLHEPWFYGEYLVYDLADFHVEIELLNPVDNLTIAASAVPYEHDDSHFYYEHDKARNFVWSVSPSYLSSTVNVGDITITSFYFPFHQYAGQEVLNATAAAVELFQQIYGEYPGNNLSVVEADFLDGMEYDGFYFLSRGFYNLYDGTPKGYLTTIAAHETAHQWWYTAVANDQALQPWLDEALCTYSEYLFYEHYYPDLANWWWDYRVNFYKPVGFIDLPIYDYQGFMPYRDATYLRGAKFFHTLRTAVGEEQFLQILQNYFIQYRGQISTAEDFWSIVRDGSGIDLEEVRSEFFQYNLSGR